MPSQVITVGRERVGDAKFKAYLNLLAAIVNIQVGRLAIALSPSRPVPFCALPGPGPGGFVHSRSRCKKLLTFATTLDGTRVCGGGVVPCLQVSGLIETVQESMDFEELSPLQLEDALNRIEDVVCIVVNKDK